MQTLVCQSLGLIMVNDDVALKLSNIEHELKLRTLRTLRRNYAEITQKLRKNYAEITQKLRRNYAKITQKLRKNYAKITQKLHTLRIMKKIMQITQKLRKNYAYYAKWKKLRRNYAKITQCFRKCRIMQNYANYAKSNFFCRLRTPPFADGKPFGLKMFLAAALSALATVCCPLPWAWLL